VLRVQERILLFAASMARKTAFCVFFRIRAKSENKFVRGQRPGFIAPSSLLPFHMRLARTMTCLACHRCGRAGRLQSRMRCLVELDKLCAVAGSARIAANEIFLRVWVLRCHGNRGSDCGTRESLRVDDTGTREESHDQDEYWPSQILELRQNHIQLGLGF
jgi:hypothetical protein